VRDGINHGARALGVENVELDFRTYPLLGEAEEEAFQSAMRAEANGIVAFPSRPKNFRSWMKHAAKSKTSVVCVSTDAPDSGRLAVVSIDTMASGSLAADLLGRFLARKGKVASTLSALSINEHAEKFQAFRSTLQSLHPEMQVLEPIEDHDTESEAYDKCRALFTAHPDLAGLYITTEASIPVIQAARDSGVLGKLSIITTDLFPKLAEEVRAGNIAATIYQRPRTQGRLAFQVLYNYLADGRTPRQQVTLVPHLVMRGNLDYFLARHPMGARAKAASATAAENNGEADELATFD
jgi:LacI family transcriptional regulator